MVRTLVGYAGAVVVTYVLGSAAAAQHVIGRFETMAGNSIAFGERLQWTLQDVLGMANPPIYPVAIAVMLFIAFAVAGFIVRRIGGLRTLGFVLAGGLGMIGLHLVLNAVFGINSIAASRDTLGLIGQGIAGAIGGLAYIWLHPDLSGRANAHAPSPEGAS